MSNNNSQDNNNLSNRNKFSSKAVRDGAMMTALTVIFMLIALYVPVFSIIGMFLSGLPLAVLYIKDGLRPAVWAAVVSVLILFAFTGNILSVLSLVIANGLPGIVAGICVKKKFNLFYSVIYTGTAFLFGIITELLMIKLFMGGIEEMFTQVFAMTQKTVEEISKIMAETGAALPDMKALNEAMELIKATFRLYFPSMLVIMSFASGYIIYSVYVWLLRKFRLTTIQTVPFSMLRAPKRMGNIAILLYLIGIFVSGKGMAGAVFLNVITVLYAIIGVCGFSFIDFKLSLRIPKGGVRAVIYIAIFFLGGVIMPLVMNICLIVGLLDSSQNFRKISSFTDDDFSDYRSGEL